MGTAIKHPVPDRVKQSFVIFDIWALWRSGLSIRVPEQITQRLTITDNKYSSNIVQLLLQTAMLTGARLTYSHKSHYSHCQLHQVFLMQIQTTGMNND